MNRLKKTICAGIVLLAIGEFVGMKMPHDEAATTRAIFQDFPISLTHAVPGALPPHR